MFSLSAFAVSSITGGVTNNNMQIQIPSSDGYLGSSDGSLTLYRDCNNLTVYVFPSYTAYGDGIVGEPGTISALSPVNLPSFVRFGSDFDSDNDEYGALSNGMEQVYTYTYDGVTASRVGGGYKALLQMRIDPLVGGDYGYSVDYVIPPKSIDGSVLTGLKYQCIGDVFYYINDNNKPVGLHFSAESDFTTIYNISFDGCMFQKKGSIVDGPYYLTGSKTLGAGQSLDLFDITGIFDGVSIDASEVVFSGVITITAQGTVRENFIRFKNYYFDRYTVSLTSNGSSQSYEFSNIIDHPIYRFFSYNPTDGDYPSGDGVMFQYPLGRLDVSSNGVYYVGNKQYVNVNVSTDNDGMYGWLIDSLSSVTGFEIAPGWTIGIILSIAVGLAIIVWILKIFLGG